MSNQQQQAEPVVVPDGEDQVNGQGVADGLAAPSREASDAWIGPTHPSNVASSQSEVNSDEEKGLNSQTTSSKQPPKQNGVTRTLLDRIKSAFGIGSSRGDSTWKTTWKRYGPLTGIFCLFLALLSLFASFAILYTSNGAATADWKYTPAT